MSEPFVPRRYALLKAEADAITFGDLLCSAILTSDRHELVRGEGSADPIHGPDWRRLLEDETVDAVIIGDAEPQTLEAARQLTIRGKPLVIVASADLPPEFVTEMSLYDAEGASMLRPWFERRRVTEELFQRLAEAPLGEIQSIQLTTTANDERFSASKVLSAAALFRIDVLRLIGGDYSQVTCIRTGGSESEFQTQTLQLGGPGLPDASWILTRGDRSGFRLRIDGRQNHAELRREAEDVVWSVGGQEVERRPSVPEHSEIQEQYRTLLDRLWTNHPRAARWNDLVRIFDIAEAADRSLRRRRTIDLHFETASERSQFKTHMATIGCGVILWTMFGIIGLLFAGAVLDPRDNMQLEAEAAGFVLSDEEFAAGDSTLTPAGREHVDQIARTMGLNETVVIIEQSDPPASMEPVDDDRRQQVWSELSRSGIDNPSRVVVRPLKGAWFGRMMQLARIIVFAPVGLFLLVQALLVITKPAASR